MEPFAASGGALGTFDRVEKAARDAVAASNDAGADSLPQQTFAFGVEMPGEQGHQRAHFALRPGPVIGGESIGGENGNAAVRGNLDDAAQSVGTGLVTRHPRQAGTGGPAAIAIHDECDMKAAL